MNEWFVQGLPHTCGLGVHILENEMSKYEIALRTDKIGYDPTDLFTAEMLYITD